jgi:type I restriction enzyme, S subunit
VKKGWRLTTVEEVASVQAGAGFPKPHQGQNSGAFPFVKVSDMSLPGNELAISTAVNWIDEATRVKLGARVFPAGTVLFPKIGGAIATNKKRLVDTPCCADNNVAGLIPRLGRVTPRFLYFWLCNHSLSEFANESNLPSIRKTTVEQFPFSLPPLSEQKRIVAILDEAFAAIATATTNTEKNLANARKVLLCAINSVLSPPEREWEGMSFGDVVIRSRGGISIKSKEYGDAGIPVLTKGDVKPFGGILHGGKFVDRQYVMEQRWPLTTIGDLIVTTRDLKPSAPFLGLVAQAPLDGSYLVNQGATYFGVDEDRVTPDFFVYWCCTDEYRVYVRSMKVGSTQVHIRQADLFAAPLHLPTLDEQKRLVYTLDEVKAGVYQLVSVYKRKLDALAELKQSLLHKAFTGELTAGDADREIGGPGADRSFSEAEV